MNISIGTYNVQKDGCPHQSATWSNRMGQVVENIAQSNLDVVALQEVTYNNISDFKTGLSAKGYSLIHSDQLHGNQPVKAVAWKTNAFSKVHGFSEAYSVVDNGRECKRNFVAVDLKDKSTNQIVRVASVHLYTEPREGGQYLGVGQIKHHKEVLEKNSENISRLVIAGDFNAEFGRGRGKEVLDVLAKSTINSLFTYNYVTHDQKDQKVNTKGSSQIDWIFTGEKSTHPTDRKVPVMIHHPFTLPKPTASDHLMHAVQMKKELTSERAPPELPKVDPKIVKNLNKCFQKKVTINRQDLIDQGVIAGRGNNLIKPLLSQGLLTQKGKGRDTVYTQGPNLPAASDSEPAIGTSKTGRTFRTSNRSNEKRSRLGSAGSIIFTTIYAVGSFFAMVAAVILSNIIPRHNHHHSHRRHRRY